MIQLHQKRANALLSPEELADMPLSSIDWLHDSETLIAWNALHAPKISKCRNFTFVQKSGINGLTERVKTCPKWAYIKHDKDITSDGIHYHFYVEFPNPRSWSAVANDLLIPVVSLQKVQSKSGILKYLTHENAPDKHHYDQSEIVTNMEFEKEIAPDSLDPWQLYCDYKDLREGRLTAREFYNRYSIYIVRHSFANQLKVAQTVYEHENCDIKENGGTCPPFRVPCSNSP